MIKGEKWLTCSDTYTKPVKEAAIWVSDEDEYEFDGYIVHFKDQQIRPADQDEHYTNKLRFMNTEKIEEGFAIHYPDEVIDMQLMELAE
jgi:hypothetical protein